MADWLERYKGLIAFLLLATIAVGGALWWERRPAGRDLVITPAAKAGAEARRITVDVDGAVARPGLYTLAEGSRVADALAMAGGATDDADLSRVNRAARLKDEQQIRVPRFQPTAQAGQTPLASAATREPASAGEPLDINTASIAQLDGLPGIGQSYAQRIVDYRERNGPFSTIEQLKETKLMPAATFDRIKDLIVAR